MSTDNPHATNHNHTDPPPRAPNTHSLTHPHTLLSVVSGASMSTDNPHATSHGRAICISEPTTCPRTTETGLRGHRPPRYRLWHDWLNTAM